MSQTSKNEPPKKPVKDEDQPARLKTTFGKRKEEKTEAEETTNDEKGE